jgi:hypothetical protein
LAANLNKFDKICDFNRAVIRSFHWYDKLVSITIPSVTLLRDRFMKTENSNALFAPKNAVRTTEDLLIQSHGILLNLQQCAALLNRKSGESLRVAISGNTEMARLLAPAKIKIGRRVLFKASVLAQILDNASMAQ